MVVAQPPAERGVGVLLLGPLVALVRGSEVDAGHPKQRAVLALLALRANQPVSTDELFDGLWRDDPPPTASATLQAYVSNLRRALEPDRRPRAPSSVIRTVGAGYQLAVDPEAIDIVRFDRLVGAAAAEPDLAIVRNLIDSALGLWRGPALADFRYDEFAQAEIARLEDRLAHAQELRMAAELSLGRSAEIVPELSRLAEQHPFRERLHGHLMLALYRAGRHAEALAAYDRLATSLREQLGLDPGPELRELQRAILDHDGSLLQHGRTGAAASRAVLQRSRPAPRGRPLSGRDTEMSVLRRAIDDAIDGVGSLVLVSGEAGIGKTRLLEAVHEEAGTGGLTTAFARCVEVGGTPPFWPWTQLVRQLGEDALVAAAGRLAPALTPVRATDGVAPPSPGPPLHRIADALVAALAQLGSERPIVLALDDLYSADPDSLALLTLVTAALGSLPVAIVGSYRDTEVAPEHPLAMLLTEVARVGRVTRLPVPHLASRDVATLVRQTAGDGVDDETIADIHHRGGGNAFFTIELAKLLATDLDSSPGPATVPATVRDVVQRRTHGLSRGALAMLRVGAVCGREFEVATTLDVTELDVDTAADAVDELLRSGLLVDGEYPGTLRFSHVIVADSLRDGLSALRRAQLHERVAASLERRHGATPGAWVSIAHHRREAIGVGSPNDAIVALERAGRHALDVDALGLAEQLVRQRLALIETLPAGTDRHEAEVAALLDLVRVYTWSEGYHSPRLGRAAERLFELTGLASGTARFGTGRPITSDDPILATLQAQFSFDIVARTMDDAERVVRLWRELADTTPDPMVILSAHLAQLILSAHTGRVDGALAAIDEATAAFAILDPLGTNGLALPLGQQSARVTMHAFAGWAHFLAGDARRAEEELREARQWSERLGHPFTTGFCVSVEGLVGAMAGSPERVSDTIAWGRPVIEDGLYGLLDAWHDLLSTWAEGRVGADPAGAAERLRAGLAVLDDRGARVVMSLYWAMVADLELLAGRPDRALEATARGLEDAATRGERFWTPELDRLASRAHGLAGRDAERSAARERARATARELGIRVLLDRLATADTA